LGQFYLGDAAKTHLGVVGALYRMEEITVETAYESEEIARKAPATLRRFAKGEMQTDFCTKGCLAALA
jgi:hypothetical protein